MWNKGFAKNKQQDHDVMTDMLLSWLQQPVFQFADFFFPFKN